MQSLYKNRSIMVGATMTLSSLLLTACGGGSSSGDKTTSIAPPTEPVQITASSWQKKSTTIPKHITVSSAVQKSRVNGHVSLAVRLNGFKSIDMREKHWQVMLDIDNNPATGFQYNNEAWSKQSGIDYLIEDGYLYKSTANDSSWSWKYERKLITSGVNNLDISIPLNPDKSVTGLCKKYNIGYIGLDQNWSIETFYPNATTMLNQSTDYCKNPPKNTIPVITLKGSDSMVVELNSTFTDPGATAFDKEDGDLTAQIHKIQMVYNPPGVYIDTSKLGKQHISYYVKDNGGLVGYKSRSVHVVKKSPKIKIDGKYDDWTTIDSYVQTANGTIKIADDSDYVYVMVESKEANENWQLLIDSNRFIPNPGYKYIVSGADFLIENGAFAKFSGTNNQHWAWNFNIPQVASISKQTHTLELMIPKNTFIKETRSIHFAFVGLDSNWQDKYSLNSRYFFYTPEVTN